MNTGSNKRKGRILTFYSFKGGSGRTMSLANVAVLLARAGYGSAGNRVLMMDWDLEAPGLHEFFKMQVSEEDLNNKRGVIDLFLDANQKFPDGLNDDNSIEKALEFIRTFFKDAAIELKLSEDIWLLKSGRFDEKYATAVQTFDWRGFYSRCHEFLAVLIRFLQSEFDFTLVDSRTGLTDVGGICTSVLPEALIAVFTPTRQGLRVTETAEKAVNYRKGADDLRPLVIYPLASRIDTSAEDLNQKWKQEYIKQFEETFNRVYNLNECSLKRYFGKVEVHYVTNYSYGESVAVLENTSIDNAHELPAKYNELVQLIIGEYVPWEMPDIPEPRLVNANDHINFAQLLAKNKEFKRAERHFYRSIEIEPQKSEAYAAFITYLEDRLEWERAETIYHDWLDWTRRIRGNQGNQYGIMLVIFVLFLLKRNKLEKAKNLTEQYLREDESNIPVKQVYANVLTKMSLLKDAEAIYIELIGVQPDNKQIKQEYAEFLKTDKLDYSKSEKLFRELAKTDREPEAYQTNIAQLLLLQGKNKEADAIIEDLLSDQNLSDYLRCQLWFFQIAYYPQYFEKVLKEITPLIDKGIRLPGRNFEAELGIAAKNNHPYLQELRELADKITIEDSVNHF